MVNLTENPLTLVIKTTSFINTAVKEAKTPVITGSERDYRWFGRAPHRFLIILIM